MSRLTRAIAAAPWALALGALSCGGTHPGHEDGGLCPALVVTPVPDGGICPEALVTAAPNDNHNHIPIGTPITYPSNPPAGGDHWPAWAVWGVHDTAVPVEYLVHNEEHGGIILFYNLALCAGGCPDLVAQLTAVINSQSQDPLCTQQAPADPDAGIVGVTTRMVLSPDPDLCVPWAAAAWGWTYQAPTSCVDPPALQLFINAHYDQASEHLCVQGQFN
jgi:hypothetical protein